MCQLKALAITKEQYIMGFKAKLHLCQVAAGKRVPTWLVAGNGAAWQRPTMHSTRTGFYLHETHCSYNVLADDAFLQANLYFSFEAIHCVKLISCK